MAKVDYSRDYYADLELSPSADVNDIKKQFRKLALKYHPDRNPGKESEVNARFQIIQSAHEILTNPEHKAKYDGHRARSASRYPTASGVKGNPWQNVSAQYPPPPKRPAMPTRPPPSAAHRYSSFNVPPSAKTAREDPETTYRAWTNMRPASKGRAPTAQNAAAGGASRPTPPPPPPPREPPTEPRPTPRTASQRQKAEAAFGTRKTGFVPRSPMGDEPPVRNTNNYSTTRQHSSLFEETLANSRRARQASSGVDPTDPLRDSFLDTRQSTPYQTHGGEKLNPFDGAAGLGRAKSHRENARRYDSDDETIPRQRHRSSSVPDEPDDTAHTAKESAERNRQGGRTEPQSDARPSTSHSSERYRAAQEDKYYPHTAPNVPQDGATSSFNDGFAAGTNRGIPPDGRNGPTVFNFSVDDEKFVPSTPVQHRFTRNSADSINTRFVAEEHANTNWQFSAGASASQDQGPAPANGRRSQSSSRLGRRSPTKERQRSRTESEQDAKAKAGGFDAEEWSQKISSEHFVPQPPRPSVSPTRAARPTKKARPVQKTMGTAGLVDEDETSSGSEEKAGPPEASGNGDGGVDSPNAMDIDPPVVEPAVVPDANGARPIHVEPSRPDWRAGDVNGAKPATKPHDLPPNQFSTTNLAGSEDAADFRTNFADFRKVEPFAEATTGLGSFSDLKSSLPFESKASAKPPTQKQIERQRLNFPEPPAAPRPPPALAIPAIKPTAAAWEKYLGEFHEYMQKWAVFDKLYIDHFDARRTAIEKQSRADGLAWLSTRSDAGIREYLRWMEQDREVRAIWTAACIEHEQKVREFMAHRDKMK